MNTVVWRQYMDIWLTITRLFVVFETAWIYTHIFAYTVHTAYANLGWVLCSLNKVYVFCVLTWSRCAFLSFLSHKGANKIIWSILWPYVIQQLVLYIKWMGIVRANGHCFVSICLLNIWVKLLNCTLTILLANFSMGIFPCSANIAITSDNGKINHQGLINLWFAKFPECPHVLKKSIYLRQV